LVLGEVPDHEGPRQLVRESLPVMSGSLIIRLTSSWLMRL
jgi:hypothetical protein